MTTNPPPSGRVDGGIVVHELEGHSGYWVLEVKDDDPHGLGKVLRREFWSEEGEFCEADATSIEAGVIGVKDEWAADGQRLLRKRI